MKSRNLSFLILAIVSITILSAISSCSKDNKPELAQKYFEQKVNEESNGSINVYRFDKTNGIEKEAMGQKFYELEFTAWVQVIKEGWKAGNSLEGHWNNFSMMAKAPQGWDKFLAGDATHLYRGQCYEFTGSLNLEKTENGWRVSNGFKINTVKDNGIIETWPEGEKSNMVEDKNVDLKKYIGDWISYSGAKELSFYQNGSDISFTGNGLGSPITNERTIVERSGESTYAKVYYNNGGMNGQWLQYYPDKDHIRVFGTEYARK